MKETKYIIVSDNNTVICEGDYNSMHYYYEAELDQLQYIISEGTFDTEEQALTEIEFIEMGGNSCESIEYLDYDKFIVKECEVIMELNIKGDV